MLAWEASLRFGHSNCPGLPNVEGYRSELTSLLVIQPWQPQNRTPAARKSKSGRYGFRSSGSTPLQAHFRRLHRALLRVFARLDHREDPRRVHLALGTGWVGQRGHFGGVQAGRQQREDV